MPKELLGEKVYTKREAAELLGVSEPTFKKYTRITGVAGRKVGACTYFTEAEIKSLLQADRGSIRMEVTELTREQLTELKGTYLDEKNGGISYEELAEADTLVSDEEIFNAYSGTYFVEEDFSSSRQENGQEK